MATHVGVFVVKWGVKHVCLLFHSPYNYPQQRGRGTLKVLIDGIITDISKQ